jgi:hypothetical protein
MPDWHYSCQCPYSSETRIDAYYPCSKLEVEQDTVNNRDVCKGCFIEKDPKSLLYGHCVLGKTEPDTESTLLGCFPDPFNPDKCRVRREVRNTECPHFCANNPELPNATWKQSTNCAKQLNQGCWNINPKSYVYSKYERDNQPRKLEPPYIPGKNFEKQQCNTFREEFKQLQDLCKNCAQTSMKTMGSGTKYPNRSYCVVGGDASTLLNTEFTNELAQQIMCPGTCKSCTTGFFGEPLNPEYKLYEASNDSSAFNKGIFYVPFVGSTANKKLTIDKNKFDKHHDV